MQAAIDAVRIAGTPQGPVPVVVLSVDGEQDVVPIFIGIEEATSIARGLEAEDIGRPLTHDLLLDVMEELGGRVDRVVVSDIDAREDGMGGTYIADLHVQTPRETVVIDARPSDSLALAARTNVPIEITESVFESGRDDREKFEALEDLREVAGEP
ncbi:bifunctional nuclease family protein [Natrialbaceae archaeon A-CW2]|uniref:Bifunctional nuclease family protein n=1 Tax=Natronosalvus hydrolyticus TaxID=2979988 RepID=A0AAP3E876_9EURY|nr:bifunctional nuclease family protein [Natronosalvus amylolyticus]MCU4752979.1 bifunctional nuclease family protein [Halobacteria archaeon AArc-curdl1]